VSSGGGGRKKKGGHEEHEEHVNHERWLVSYADMLTLLFVLFVVLFSMSSVDKDKFAKLAAGLNAGFGAQSVAFNGQTSSLDGSGNSTNVVPIDPGTNPGLGGSGEGKSKEQRQAIQRAVQTENRAHASRNAQAAAKEAENLKEVEKKISDALAKVRLQDSVKFTIDERGLVVTVVTNEVTFEGNRANLRDGGAKILGAIAPTLAGLPNNIEVDGHTNQLKVATSFYPSGWELSTARASTVVRYLEGHGIVQNRLQASGFADTRPLIEPNDPKSITMNRRVDVVVLSTLPAEQRSLLPSAAGDDAKLHSATTSTASATSTTADGHEPAGDTASAPGATGTTDGAAGAAESNAHG
jgi:chemotaxis protein MotB